MPVSISPRFEYYATGNYSLWTLRKKIIEEGLTAHYKDKKIPESTIGRILQQPLYYGLILFKGKLYRGNHTPIVSEELFNIVQDIREGNARKKSKADRKFTYTGLINCANCGCLITAEKKKEKYTYYHCTNAKRTCNKKSVNEGVLDKEYGEVLKLLQMDKQGLELTRNSLKESFSDEKKYHDEMIKSLEKDLNVLQDRFDKVYIDKIDQKISEDFWKRKSDEIIANQNNLLEAIELHKIANRNYFEGGNRLLELANRAYELYIQQSAEEKREFINYMVSNSTLSGQNLSVELKEPFVGFAECVKSGDYLGR